MTSQRHTRRDPILDAAHAQILEVGFRRTTLADVARRAGVSRMTVYRQHNDLGSMVAALLTRELTQLMEEVDSEISVLPSALDRLIESAMRVVERMHDHPLYRRILDLDPELLLPLIVDRFGSSQVVAMAHVAARIREGQADGSIRDVDPDIASTTVLLLCQSFVFSARMLDQAAMKELRPMLEGYLQ